MQVERSANSRALAHRGVVPYRAESAHARLTSDGFVPTTTERSFISEFDRRLAVIVEELRTNDTHLAAMSPQVADLERFASSAAPNLKPRLQRHINDICTDWRFAWREKNARYRPENNGLYPLRTVTGKPLKIVRIAARSVRLRDGSSVLSDMVKPYISKARTELQRAALYDENLDCREIAASDVPQREHALIGQHGVFAARDLAAHECIGVYGGAMLQAEHALLARNSEYMLDTTVPDPSHPAMIGNAYLKVDGDTILSRINTAYRYDTHDRPVAQADRGYNVSFKAFHASLERAELPQDLVLHAGFTTAPIAKGTELRVNYAYSPQEIRQLLEHLEAVARRKRSEQDRK